MVEYLKINDWEKWQSYRKDRGQPPWIKIHRRVMRNPKWVSLTDAERGQLVAMWLLAADHDGVILASPEMIQKLCYMSKPPDLNKFTDLGFIENGWRQHDVNLASDGRQHDSPKAETETEADKRRIEDIVHFKAFWDAYPKKKDKGHALTAWQKIKDPKTTLELILSALEWQKISHDWTKEGGQFIPLPSTYLNGRRWEDEQDTNWIKNDDMIRKFGEKGARTVETMKKWLEETDNEK